MVQDSQEKNEPQQTSEGSKIAIRNKLGHELDQLEISIAELKVQYEQFFSGILPREPEKEHQLLKRSIRNLHNAPFKNSAINYRLRTLETRYSSLNTYWQRVLRERESGTYIKDNFKADLRDRRTAEAARLMTSRGQAEQGMKQLFQSYKIELEKQTGRKQSIDFESFRRNIAQRAKTLKESSGAEDLSFRVVVKDGKVAVQAKTKNSANNKV